MVLGKSMKPRSQYSVNVKHSKSIGNIKILELLKYYMFLKNFLHFYRAQKDNMGKYVCRASNSIGAVDAQVQLYRK